MIKIDTNRAPAAIGPYSQAMASNGLIFTSGQILLDPVSGEIVGINIEEQTRQVMENLKAVLEAAGSDMDSVVKTTCYLSDMSNFFGCNQVYSEYFANFPARSCFAVKGLPKGVLIEVEAVAEQKGK